MIFTASHAQIIWEAWVNEFKSITWTYKDDDIEYTLTQDKIIVTECEDDIDNEIIDLRYDVLNVSIGDNGALVISTKYGPDFIFRPLKTLDDVDDDEVEMKNIKFGSVP